MVRSLSALAALTVCAGTFFVACDKDDASTTSTTSALYDAGIIAPQSQTVPMEDHPASPALMNAPVNSPVTPVSPTNGATNGARLDGVNAANPTGANADLRYGGPGSLPRAMAPNSPANGYGNANPGMNAGPNNGVGAVNSGNAAGSMNGTQPMNTLGSSNAPNAPYRPAPPPPNSTP